MSDPAPPRSDNLRGAGWLIADMGLNIWALSIVKAVGADYPSVQIVFLRVVVGLVVILPWVWRDRGLLGHGAQWPLQALRVGLSALTLAASFYAIARVPFAVFSALNFTRPILLMVLAALLLSERITPRRWVAAGVAMVGALIAASPGTIAASWGLAALVLAVTTGTLAVIVTRRLKGTPEVVMMLVYTAGIGLVMAPFALWLWEPVAAEHWPFLIIVGIAAQLAQLCFIRAHWLGEAGVLGPVSYLSLVLSTAAGFFFFAEVPGWPLLAGAVLILAANLAVTRAR
ncbi:DMT family transporter [Roseicyclus mahoneyensis]|uniref:EamA-like transporter family protein n=1 Tax=Roseicyclus mahoneyensis TaxID=164332 RepID=A0A316GNK3_9RHOB|nr:DMT family transporter [Roseicyclus mahoneyensis]PWK62359.1 EamA-like transporter family protein [Roseicyclus mahoneyensis]